MECLLVIARSSSSLTRLLAIPAIVLVAACQTVPPVRTPATVIATTCKKPEYPPESLSANETGAVLLKLLIDADGNVTDAVVERSSGHARLDEAARGALAGCKFRPASADGKPVADWTSIEFTWRTKRPEALPAT